MGVGKEGAISEGSCNGHATAQVTNAGQPVSDDAGIVSLARSRSRPMPTPGAIVPTFGRVARAKVADHPGDDATDPVDMPYKRLREGVRLRQMGPVWNEATGQ